MVNKKLAYLLVAGLGLGYTGNAFAQKATDSKLEKATQNSQIPKKENVLNQYSSQADTTLPDLRGYRVRLSAAELLESAGDIPLGCIEYNIPDSAKFREEVGKQIRKGTPNPRRAAIYSESGANKDSKSIPIHWYNCDLNLPELFKQYLEENGCSVKYFNSLSESAKVIFFTNETTRLDFIKYEQRINAGGKK